MHGNDKYQIQLAVTCAGRERDVTGNGHRELQSYL